MPLPVKQYKLKVRNRHHKNSTCIIVTMKKEPLLVGAILFGFFNLVTGARNLAMRLVRGFCEGQG